MVKEWIRLFQIIYREDLEKSLNEFIRDHDVKEIKVWNAYGHWHALVRYSYPQGPSYSKNKENLDE